MGHITEKGLKNFSAMLQQAKFNAVDNTDEQALQTRSLYPDWEDYAEGDTLAAGERVNYLEVLYKVLQTHQKQNTWNPVDTPSLFAKVLIEDPGIIPEWEQPTSTNGYMTGDKVTHIGSTWESMIDYNVWEPGVLGTEAYWKEIEV